MDIMKLCKKDIDKICAYCKHSSSEIDASNIICRKKGCVSKHDTCRSFCYDPTKRKPPLKPRVRQPIGDLSFE